LEGVKIGIGIVLLGSLWHMGLIDPARLGRGLSSHPWSMAAGIGLQGAMFLLLAHRWRIVARAGGVEVETALAARLTLTSHFFSTCLPGNGAGDLVKGWIFSRRGTEFGVVLGTMVLDRIMGMAGLFVSWSIFLAVGIASHPGSTRLLLPFLGLAIVGAGGLLAVAAFSGRILSVLDWIAARSGSRRWDSVVGFARKILGPVAAGGASPSTLAKALAISLAIQSCYIATAWLAGYILSNSASLVSCGVVLPLVSLVNAIPLSPGGIGLGESVGAAAMREFGMAPDAGAQIVLVVRIFSVFWALVGGFCYLSLRPQKMNSDPER
jgi:hypothetical protein